MNISVRFLVSLWMVLFVDKIVTEVIVDVERDAKMSPVCYRNIFHIFFFAYLHRVNLFMDFCSRK